MPPDVQGFGRCLLHAILAMLARGHASAVVLNSDSPTLPTALLVRTADGPGPAMATASFWGRRMTGATTCWA